MLICHTHSSQFMEWQNLGITTLKHATCAPNVFKKIPEKQITTDFIYLTFSTFLTISHINYWDHVNSWKNLWKFWNGPLCKNKSGPFPLLNVAGYWKSSSTKACAKKLCQILSNNINNREGKIGLRIYVRCCRLVLFRFNRSIFCFLVLTVQQKLQQNFTVTSVLFLSQWQTSKSSLLLTLQSKLRKNCSFFWDLGNSMILRL